MSEHVNQVNYLKLVFTIFEPQYQLILAKVCRVGNNLNNQTTRVMKRLEVKKLKTLTDIDSSYFFNIISEILFNENELKYSRLLQPSRGNRKKFDCIEVYGGQRSLAFELTTTILCVEIHKKCARGAIMATMEDYASAHFM